MLPFTTVVAIKLRGLVDYVEAMSQRDSFGAFCRAFIHQFKYSMPTHSIQQYYKVAEKLEQYGGTKMESAVSQAFYALLNEYAHQKELVLVPQIWVKGKLGRKVKPDGTLKDSLRQDWGYWESKDEADNIDEGD